MTALICAKCKQIKPSSDFSNGEQRKAGFRRCRECVAAYNREHNKTRASRPRSSMTPEQLAAAREHDRNRDRDRSADTWFRYRYGLTLSDVERMIEEQGGVCAVCTNPETKTDPRTGVVRRLSVDHDHRTGLPRRMLCQRCNWVLSRVDDDVELLERFVSYLDTFAPRG